MFRTALRPRWLVLLAVVLIAATAMSVLGQWQLERARERGTPTTAEGAPRPLPEVLQARRTFPPQATDARVVARGTWDGDRQLLVSGRELGGRRGYWVLTPLRLDDGSAVGVVRGWVAAPEAAVAPSPAAPQVVEVTGRLRPTEPSVPRAPGEASRQPAGQVERIASPDLINRWPYPLLTGYLVQEDQRPAVTAGALRPVPPPAPDRRLDWRNVSYALQWWVFAAFGLFLWWRAVRDDHRSRRAAPQRGNGHPADLGPSDRDPADGDPAAGGPADGDTADGDPADGDPGARAPQPVGDHGRARTHEPGVPP